MRWVLGVATVLACALLFGWGAAAAATPERAAFKVTLTATLTKDWRVSRTVEGECVETTTSRGFWKLILRTRRPSGLVFTRTHAGRPLRIDPGVVRAISGSAIQTGSIRRVSQAPRCVPTEQVRTCPGRRRIVRDATVPLTSPRLGVARFARLRGVAGAYSFGGTCPGETADVRALRTGLRLADAPLSAADVFGRNVPRFFITGNTRQVTTIDGDDTGRVIERVNWKLTFTRIA
jgi:hypothetical protein